MLSQQMASQVRYHCFIGNELGWEVMELLFIQLLTMQVDTVIITIEHVYINLVFIM